MNGALWSTLPGMAYTAPVFRSLACASIALLVGCGGIAPTTSVAPVAESDFAPSAKQVVCDLMTKCCSPGFDAATACNAENYSMGPYAYRKYDPARGGACVATLRSFASSCTITSKVTDCQNIYVGTQAIGAPCEGSTDCAGYADHSAYCGPSPTANMVCQLTAKAGEACNGTVPATGGLLFTGCGAGLYCATSGLCTPQGGPGQPCDRLNPAMSCNPSLRCDTTSAKCANKLPVGASCVVDSSCAEDNCDNGICAGPPSVESSNLCRVNTEAPLPSLPADADAGI
jgi:hypothetical protein